MNWFQRIACKLLGVESILKDKIFEESAFQKRQDFLLAMDEMLRSAKKGELPSRRYLTFTSIVYAAVERLDADAAKQRAEEVVNSIIHRESFLDEIVVRLKNKQLT